VSGESSNQKGNVAEAAVLAAAVKLGVNVLRPQFEHGRYDIAFEIAGKLIRVQCKWAPRRDGVVVVNLAGFRYTATGHVRSVYTADEIDAVVAYCEELDECYYLPVEMVDGMRALHLRLEAPKNAQRAALNWAPEHTLAGAIAQLGERLRGTQEVAGSSPASSIKKGAGITFGAHRFRNLFGWYMQRASRGETFEITRRGKPFARLLPPEAQLELVEPADRRARAAA
jgi:prevent-host-death family protein